MAKIERFEDLEIWKLAVSIAVDVYLLCDNEPLKTDWGMKDQIRRAACSMSDNIAEGFEYNNNPDFIPFLNYAKGSSGEFRNKLSILNLANKIDDEICKELYSKSIEFSSKTKSLIDYLRKFEAEKRGRIILYLPNTQQKKSNITTLQLYNISTKKCFYPDINSNF